MKLQTLKVSYAIALLFRQLLMFKFDLVWGLFVFETAFLYIP